MKMTNGIKVTEEIKYIIGIDFGHGETSAAYCELDNDLPPSDLSFEGDYSIPSAIHLSEPTENGNQEVYIGRGAFIEMRKDPTGFRAYFKDSPKNMIDGQKECLKMFFKSVYKDIKDRLMLKEDDHAVFIACPSNSDKWDEEAKHEYLQLAIDAGLPIINENFLGYAIEGVIRESRAAYIQLLKKSPKHENILVIDFGSSTADITYHEGEDSPIDKSYQIGAQWVETGILEFFEKDDSQKDNLKLLRETYPNGYEGAKFEIRSSKEMFYKNKNSDLLECRVNYRNLTNGQMQTTKLDKELEKEDLDKILEPYKEKIYESFLDFKETYLQNKSIDLMVITGGASRMPFIKDIAENVFEATSSFQDENPSLTVSKGIASAGRIDIKLFRLYQQLTTDETIAFKDISSKIYESAADAISRSIIQSIDSVYEDNDNLETINKLESEIKKVISGKGDIIKSALQKSASDQLKNHIESNIKPALGVYVKQYFPSFDIRSIKPQQLNNDVRINLSIEQTNAISTLILNSTIAMEEKGLEAVAMVLWNLGIAVPFGVTATLIGDAVVAAHNAGRRIARWFRDEKYDKQKDGWKYEDIGDNIDALAWNPRRKDSILDPPIKRRVASEYKKQKEDFKSKLIKDIIEQLDNDDKLKNQIESSYKDHTENYILSETRRIQAQLK